MFRASNRLHVPYSVCGRPRMDSGANIWQSDGSATIRALHLARFEAGLASVSGSAQSFGSPPAVKAISTSRASFRRSASVIQALASSRHPTSWISAGCSALIHKSSKSLVYASGSSPSLRIRIASCRAMRIDASRNEIRFMPASAMNADSIWSVSQPDGLTNAASLRMNGPSRPASSASQAREGISSGPIILSASLASTSCESKGTE